MGAITQKRLVTPIAFGAGFHTTSSPMYWNFVSTNLEIWDVDITICDFQPQYESSLSTMRNSFVKLASLWEMRINSACAVPDPSRNRKNPTAVGQQLPKGLRLPHRAPISPNYPQSLRISRYILRHDASIEEKLDYLNLVLAKYMIPFFLVNSNARKMYRNDKTLWGE